LCCESCTGSHSTLEYPSRVNFSGPNLYCIARTLGKWSRHSIGLAGATRLTQSDFRLNLLLLKGEGSVLRIKHCSLSNPVLRNNCSVSFCDHTLHYWESKHLSSKMSILHIEIKCSRLKIYQTKVSTSAKFT